ncbi:hypothetical protein A3I25_00470 [Candidatus Nomurabacteria bacterium RIFCSPLOWO2_02_FULL_42_17]|uniref:HD domain-containing protein n=2 Tax=Candidatus Nomuraibacteriota TaxID=1752729 RepID=A0A1F6WJ75_9BACT|nr:MAG: PolyA polymerase [Parcubacteria group bacterium GW2011_GWA2_42_18]OGI81957.1 MAG: hypothetical protein A3B93_02315 [Candidatus Nomurabacteria bacterium RIFCSPHIGHO2_02_FULL_42_24]OGI96842.1 MAG: hypothetical protein A3I25_00470 [Candidatus Nomurabacteria bacterium RIFCSPLOWO2_02_FULL_42_17]
MLENKEFKIPQEIADVCAMLNKAGFEVYLVGGCVRDLILGRIPKDWDITTNAKPEEIVKIFPKTVYENTFGTVVVINETENNTLKVVEITPYRLEGKYTDKRHPDSIKWADNLEDDLKRRDFTVNAMAYKPSTGEIVDFFDGKKDLKNKIIHAVGEADERFREDALRMLRAVRLACELGFVMADEITRAITKNASLIKEISAERTRDEFLKIIESPEPMAGLALTQKLGLLKHIIPELEEGIGCKQNSDHIYEVFEHLSRALQHSADRQWPLGVRLATLFHDIGKPRAREWLKEKGDYTFYGHDVIGARVVEKILARLCMPKKESEKIVKLVRYHMFFSDTDQITLSAVRRLVKNVGPENVWDLMKVRQCDRIGMGRPKESPYRLRKYEAMIEEAARAPVSVSMLKINGNRLMKISDEKPGPRLGWILHALLEEVLENPDLNTVEYMEKRAIEFSKLPEIELKKLGLVGKEKKLEEEEKELTLIRRRHFVK